MTHISTILIPLQLFVLTVAAKPLAHIEMDKILDPEELSNMALPPSSDSAWADWDDWDTWDASEDIKKNFTYYRSGYDEDGSVGRSAYTLNQIIFYTANFGKYKYRELAHSPPENMEEFWNYIEQLIRRVEMDGKRDNNKGVVIILDLEGFSLKNFASDKALKLALKLFISFVRVNSVCNYGFIINANYAAESFLMLAKPFVGDFIEKVEIYGTRSEKWKPRLLSKIPASQLPPAYGGSKDWKPLPEQVTKS